MKCCVNCFKDPFLQDTIKKLGEIGNCDFCSSKNVAVYDISVQNEVSEKILELLQAYEPSDFPEAKQLKYALHDDWEIFSGGVEAVQTLLNSLCSSYNEFKTEMFLSKVIIPQAYDDEYIKENCVIKNQSWSQFSESIKYNNRFHNANFNGDKFSSFLSLAVEKIGPEDKFYRARIAPSKLGFKKNEMYAPPKGFRKQGRANPDGICVLYLASDEETALNEVRANKYDYVTIGTFKTKRELEIVNLSKIFSLSAFDFDELALYYINKGIFKEMALELAKPQRRSDSYLEYLPTQYISEFIKSGGRDGVAYNSTLHNGGLNLAMYDEDAFNCVSVKTVEVTESKYEFKTIKKGSD